MLKHKLMDYTQVSFTNEPSLNEVLIAWLGDIGFVMFEEAADGIEAYIPFPEFDEMKMREALSSVSSLENIPFQISLVKDQNWNKEWESNFEPVLLSERVFIRAPFHEAGEQYQYRITIEPKMSFGTGHHATTALMIELMLQADFNKKKVLDMGCGTAVLGILAEKLGATNVLAIDIDEWAYENSLENTQRNDCRNIEVKMGDASLIGNSKFDIILANINRNVLLSDIPKYSEALNEHGRLFLSGILLSDKEIIHTTAIASGLEYITEAGLDNWLALLFKKK